MADRGDMPLDIETLKQMFDFEVSSREKKPPVLDELNVEGIVKKLKEFRASENKRRVVVMTGAGISTAAGIPDFRSPGTGLYDNLQKYNLPSPQAVFEIKYFKHNPQPFYDLANELYPAKFKPTLSHYFIRLLEEEGLLLRAFTQNIDTLERRAGISDDVIVEAHGAFNTAHCITCGTSYPSETLKDKVFAGELPLCEEKGCAHVPPEDKKWEEPYRGLVKPDIVFFGEGLPDRFALHAMEDLPKCELLIIMGTSLKVHPFASLVSSVPEDCPRLLINLEKVGEMDPIMSMIMGGGGGLDFDEKTAYRDVFLQDTCDNGCRTIAQKLGLEERLLRLFEDEHKRLDSEISAMMATLSIMDNKIVQATVPEAVVPMSVPVVPITPELVCSEEPMSVQELGTTAVTSTIVEKPTGLSGETLED